MAIREGEDTERKRERERERGRKGAERTLKSLI
jgi:hypothetical protein